MRIISNFRDYYDNTGYYGSDDRVWVRKRQEHQLKHIPHRFAMVDHSPTNHFDIKTNKVLSDALYDIPNIRQRWIRYSSIEINDFIIVVGFCGKLYPIITHWREEEISGSYIHSTYSDVDAYLSMIDDFYDGKVIISDTSSFNSNFAFTRRGIDDWIEKYNERINLQEIFIDLNTPLFILQRHNGIGVSGKINLVINPCMMDYNLMSQFHPFTVHQEIDMYLGNDLAMCPLNDFEMSDELIRDSKGMDKWSFRQKGPKKRKMK